MGIENKVIYKTNRGCRTRPVINASVESDIDLRAGPVGPHEGRYQTPRSR